MALSLLASVRRPHGRSHRRSPRLRALLLTALVALGMCVGIVGGATPAGASLPPVTTAENTIAWAIKKLIVTERALHGLPYIQMSTQLRLSARRHNLAMAKADTMSHQLPGEPWFGRREQLAGYWWSWAGENIGWNSDMTLGGVTLLQRLMYNEKPPNDGHRENILNTHYRQVGVDVYFDKVNHKVWLTTDFGHRN